MTPEQDIIVDRERNALACSEERENVMAYRLKWKTPPSATRICWLTTDVEGRWIASLPQDYAA
jgi:hypothetical protein